MYNKCNNMYFLICFTLLVDDQNESQILINIKLIFNYSLICDYDIIMYYIIIYYIIIQYYISLFTRMILLGSLTLGETIIDHRLKKTNFLCQIKVLILSAGQFSRASLGVNQNFNNFSWSRPGV